MGCAQSKIDNEESVSRCKDRRNIMREAVIARNAFASGYSGYAIALKNTGAALSDYGHGETMEETDNLNHHHHHHNIPSLDPNSEPQPPPPPPMDGLPPPPPPLPNFSPSPIKRSVSMPTMKPRKPRSQIGGNVIIEEDDREEESEMGELDNGDREGLRGKMSRKNGTEAEVPAAEIKAVPPMPESKGMAWDYFFMVENMTGPSLSVEEESRNDNDDNDDNDENDENGEMGFSESENVGGDNGGFEPKTPEKAEETGDENEVKKGKQIEHSNTAPPDFGRMGNGEMRDMSVSLIRVLGVIDDYFLKASESAQEVSKLLEANRLHYHSNFADNRGHIDHSARVMRVITWNRSFKGIPNIDVGKDDFDSEEYETHATILDKMLAWEKKLYDEVKQGELMKLEYQRKVGLLNKQKKRKASIDSLEKTKAAVSHLHTRYIVDMQSMDSTVSEVNRLRDDQLYPRLVLLVGAMANMWESMCEHHDNQLKTIIDLKSLDTFYAPKETTNHHHERTKQLLNVIQHWHSQFEQLVTHQKKYIQALNSWLKLNLIPIESSLKEKISSPPRVQNPPIQTLLISWHDTLEKLPDELAKSAISSFSAVVQTIINHQDEEMKLKQKCEETRKEFLKKNQAFEEWYRKYMQQRGPDETDNETGEDGNPNDDRVSEKRVIIENLRRRLEEESEAHKKHCVQVREKSLSNLKMRLPELFRAMSDYAHACSDVYGNLRSITRSQNSKSGPP